MNSYKKLFNNMIIFGIGILGSRIVSFLLVPLYTYYLSQGEYGTADLVTTTVSMLLPIVSGTMYESIIRYVMNENYDKNIVMANALTISAIGYTIFLLLYPLFKYFNVLDESLEFMYILLLVDGINRLFSQYTRGIGESKKFALNGIVRTLFTGVFNILFLVYFEMGLQGYFMAYILGFTASIIYLMISVNPLKDIKFSNLSKDIQLIFLHYSIPLIPNSLMWWLINSSSRYLINWFIGIEANGVFAVSSRIPALINIVSEVFSQAWQLSAFEEYEKKDDSLFQTKVFDLYFSVLLITSAFIITFIKPVFSIAFSEEYYNAWQPVPFLLLGTTFSAASGFLGVAYTATKKTRGVFKTSIYGGAISLLLNIIFIPTLGVIGAGISSMFSFLAMFLIRYWDTKKLIYLEINWKKVISIIFLIGLQIMVIFIGLSNKLELIFNIGIILVVLIINRKIFASLFKMLSMIKTRKN